MSRRIVVKIGTSVLTGGTRHLDRPHMIELARQCARLHADGHEVLLCTSGAIAAGREALDYPELPPSLPNKQMLAAVGQSRLIHAWGQLFEIYGVHVGQVLLTRADVEHRLRFLNARDTLQALLKHRIIPIINENDAVATTEIKVGDNDNLSALVAALAEADLLILLTDQPGLFDADPRSNPEARLIPEIRRIDDTLRKLAGGSTTGLGVGGMATKLQAADIARRSGADVVIAAGHAPNAVLRIMSGEQLGTRFPALEQPLENRKRWIFAGTVAGGRIVVDDGAARALAERGSSLLAAGIQDVAGAFERGDTVAVTRTDGAEIARGIARYSATELQKIKGCRSEEIEKVLGYGYGPAAVHRDDMILV